MLIPWRVPAGRCFLENKLLLISINFTPKTCHSCFKKMVHYVFQLPPFFLVDQSLPLCRANNQPLGRQRPRLNYPERYLRCPLRHFKSCALENRDFFEGFIYQNPCEWQEIRDDIIFMYFVFVKFSMLFLSGLVRKLSPLTCFCIVKK